MKDNHDHLSDQELIMEADGELPFRRAANVREHLLACWSCRERAETFEHTIGQFIRERNLEFDTKIPPPQGPQTLLHALVAEAASKPEVRVSRSGVVRRTAPGVFLFLCVLRAIAVFFRMKGPSEGTRPITIAEVCRKGQPDDFEIDYLITPDLGGALSVRNLWPQPYREGQVEVATAQRDIAADRIYFHTEEPLE